MSTTIINHLNQRVALVTGGARGIGLAIAQDFINQGCKVVLADNGVSIDGSRADPEIAGNTAALLGDSAVAFTDDIATINGAARAVNFAKERWGRLDLVVNCAAILRDHFIFKAKPTDFDEVIRVNLAAAYYVLAAASPIFREQVKVSLESESEYTWGRVVNIVSTAGFYGNFGQSSYASAKSGLLGLTRCVALDLARSGIMVNAVAPFARSRVTETIVPANEAQSIYKERAMKVDPERVATVVSWLCSDAGAGISGQLFGVRGREVFLFSQPRPVQKVVLDSEEWGIEGLGQNAKEYFEKDYIELTTDLEEFNTEPAT